MEIQTTVQDFSQKAETLNLPPDTPILVIVGQSRKKVTRAKPLSQDQDDPFQAILNIKPSKGIRPVVEVLREIRDNE